MHACQLASIVRERNQGGLITDVPEIHAEIGFAAEQFSQLRNRESVAGMHADNRRSVREKLVDLSFQLLRQILELRSQARLKPLPGPHKLATEFSQAGSVSLLSFLGLKSG